MTPLATSYFLEPHFLGKALEVTARQFNFSRDRSRKQSQVNQKRAAADSTPPDASSSSSVEPVLLRDQYGAVDYDSLPEVIQWFLDFDQRVAVIKHAKVEELFQWKQEQSRLAGEEVFNFNRAEDRLAIGILQSVAHNPTERELHSWIAQLLNALDRATKATEDVSSAYGLDISAASSVVGEAQKIPAATTRVDFLFNCWLESLCTAEIRVLGWLYREFYSRPFHPDNF